MVKIIDVNMFYWVLTSAYLVTVKYNNIIIKILTHLNDWW